MSNSNELYMCPQLLGIELPRNVAECTSQVGHMSVFQDLAIPRHWPWYGKVACIKPSQHFLPIPSTNGILHASLYRDIPVAYRVVPCLLELSKDPISRRSKQMQGKMDTCGP